MDTGEITYGLVEQIIGKTGKLIIHLFCLQVNLSQACSAAIPLTFHGFLLCLYRFKRRNHTSESQVY